MLAARSLRDTVATVWVDDVKRLSGPTLRHEIDRAPAHTDHKRAEPRGLISAVHPREALRQGPVAAPAVGGDDG